MASVVDQEVTRSPQVVRTPAEVFMRRLLRIPAVRPTRRQRDVHGIFSISIAISGARCVITYLILPLLAPIFGQSAGVGPAIGIPVGIVALVFDVRGVRRFWLADHKQRWPMTALYAAVMVMVLTFLGIDISHIGR